VFSYLIYIFRISQIKAAMNKKHRQRDKQRAEEKSDDSHLPIPVVRAAESNERGHKSTEQGENAATLHQVSRWSRVRKWASTATVAEVGMFLLTLVIAASSIYYTKYAKRQWKVMRESNEISRKALESVQRAFVLFSPNGSTIGTLVENNKVIAWTPQISIANRGATAAQKMTHHANFYISEKELPKEFDFHDTGEAHSDVLGPQDAHTVSTDPIPIRYIQAVQNHTEHVYVYGWVAYGDVFAKRHVTQFCYELAVNSISGDLTDPKYLLVQRFNLCARHNCVDDDCAK